MPAATVDAAEVRVQAPEGTRSHDLLALPTFRSIRSHEVLALPIDYELPGFPRELREESDCISRPSWGGRDKAEFVQTQRIHIGGSSMLDSLENRPPPILFYTNIFFIEVRYSRTVCLAPVCGGQGTSPGLESCWDAAAAVAVTWNFESIFRMGSKVGSIF